MSHPHIIDSLLAIRRFFEWFIITIVGPKPAKPEIAERVISDLLKDFIEDDVNSDIIYRIRTRSRTIITDTRRPYRYYNI